MNVVEEQWQEVLAKTGNNMLLDSPAGKALFLAGVALALGHVRGKSCKALLADLGEFKGRCMVEAYKSGGVEAVRVIFGPIV